MKANSLREIVRVLPFRSSAFRLTVPTELVAIPISYILRDQMLHGSFAETASVTASCDFHPID